MKFLISLLLVLLPAAVFGQDEVDEILRSILRVEFAQSSVFVPELQQGHGTGFIVELNDRKGIVFTNHHVVELDGFLNASQASLHFNVPETEGRRGTSEKIPGKVIFRSPIHDFSAIEFNVKDLERSKNYIRAVRGLLDREGSGKIIRPRQPVIVAGNPYDSQNSITEGIINTVHVDMSRGYYIQTSAPINPGNSGGPMLALLEDGSWKVVGINTMKNTEADNMGFAIPIWVAVEEFRRWKADPHYEWPRALPFTALYLDEDDLSREGLRDLVAQEIPGFFNHFPGIILVDQAGISSGLQTGDVLLQVNGKTFGHLFFELRNEVAIAKERSFRVKILRDRKVVELEVPIIHVQDYLRDYDKNFVMSSGLFMVNRHPLQREYEATDVGGVLVEGIIPLSPADQLNGFYAMDIVRALEVGGVRREVNSVSDVINFMRPVEEGTPVRYYLRRPVRIRSGEGLVTASTGDGFRIYAPQDRFRTLPASDLITPDEFDLGKFRKGFDLSFQKPKNVDWRRWVKCSDRVKGST